MGFRLLSMTETLKKVPTTGGPYLKGGLMYVEPEKLRRLHLMCVAAQKYGFIRPVKNSHFDQCFTMDIDDKSLIFWFNDKFGCIRSISENQINRTKKDGAP